MKSLVVLLFGILAIFCLQSTALEKQGKSIANKEEYLEEINEERRQWAKDNNIPNMNKLIWDDFLETKTQMNDRSGYKKTMRYVFRDGGDSEKIHIENMKQYLFKEENLQYMIKGYHSFFVSGMEELTPAQQRIGCSPHEEIVPGDGPPLKFKTLCFLEPEGLGDSWDVPRGEPGSACPEGYENEDGLCALVESSSHGTCLLGVILAMVMIYGNF